MSSTTLKERDGIVLKEIVKGYISSGDPVGSRTLSKSRNFSLSPASIRNVMADLEDMGYIKQIHVSSGRVPTDKGYRFFVDNIGDSSQLSQNEIDRITNSYCDDVQELECLLEYTSKVLSEVSSYAGIVLLHKFHDKVFKHIKFLKLNQRQTLAVFITEAGLINNQVIETEEDFSQEDLDLMSQYLNKRFNSETLKKIRTCIETEDAVVEKRSFSLAEKAVSLFNVVLASEEGVELYIGGASNMLEHPDFVDDIKQIRSIVKAFEEKQKLIGFLYKYLMQEGVHISIGPEVLIGEMDSCSFVTHTYNKGGTILGVLGLIGPKRMEYSRTIGQVHYTAKVLSEILSTS